MKILNFKKLRNSFKAAFCGLRSAYTEQVFRIFCFCALFVIISAFILNLPIREKIIVIFLIILILTLELINSQIEKILNILQPNHDSRVKMIKDLSAAAVLIACLGSLIVGVLIFSPYLQKFW